MINKGKRRRNAIKKEQGVREKREKKAKTAKTREAIHKRDENGGCIEEETQRTTLGKNSTGSLLFSRCAAPQFNVAGDVFHMRLSCSHEPSSGGICKRFTL